MSTARRRHAHHHLIMATVKFVVTYTICITNLYTWFDKVACSSVIICTKTAPNILLLAPCLIAVLSVEAVRAVRKGETLTMDYGPMK